MKYVADLFADPEDYTVEERGDTAIDGEGTLGYADYRTGRITIPTFATAYMNAIRNGDGVMQAVIKGVKDYILGHEKHVELNGMRYMNDDSVEPQLEAAYLNKLEQDALNSGNEMSGEWVKYLAALTLHEKRHENDGWFSKAVDKYYNIKGKVKGYGSSWIRNYVDEILEPDLEVEHV